MSKNTQISELINYLSVDGSGNIVITGSLIGPAGATYATQSYVTTAISNLVNAAPTALDTLAELSAALNNDASFATTVTNSLAGKLALTGGTLTGTLNGTNASFSGAISGTSGSFNGSVRAVNLYNLYKSDNTTLGGQLAYDSSINQLYLWNNVSTGYFSIYLNGTERFKIAADSTISLSGSTTVKQNFKVLGDTYTSVELFDGGTGDPGYLYLYYNGTRYFSIGPNDTYFNYGNVGIGTASPTFPLDLVTSTSGAFKTIAQFQNTDYTTGNQAFIRVRQWVNAGGSSSSYFGTGQDGNLYIIANNSARGGDLIINSGTGNATFNGTVTVNSLTTTNNLYWNSGDGVNWYIEGQANGPLIRMKYHGGSTNRSGSLGWKDNSGNRYDALVWQDSTVWLNGNLGIGTSSPSYNLDIQGSEAKLQLKNNSTGGGTWIIASTYNSWSAGGGKYVITSDGGSTGIKFAIDSSGNTGIGTYSPSYKLDVSGDIRATGTIYANANGAMYFRGGDDVGLYDVNIANTMGIFGAQDSTIGTIKLGSGGGTLSGANGNIGVNNTNPLYKLDVAGSVRSNRVIYNWYNGAWQGNSTYWHMKTNLWGGGSPSGNTQYTMSYFKGYSYSYSAHILEGGIGFHNWSAGLYNLRTTGNLFTTAYVSSDGYIVLVVPSGQGETGITLDWHQHWDYPFQSSVVTAAGLYSATTGKY